MTVNVREAFGLNLSESELRDAVKRLAFFAPCGSGQYTRDLHDFLALQGISMLPSGGQTARAIYEKVVETIGPQFEFEEVLDALRRLVAKNDIQCSTKRAEDQHARFQVSIETRNAMRDKVRKEESLESEVLTEWKIYLRRSYPQLSSSEINDLTMDLRIYMIKLLSQHSVETIQLYYGDEESLLSLLDRLKAKGTGDIWRDCGVSYNDIRSTEVLEFFHQADGKRKQYIASMMHSLFILQLTTLDPQCAAIVRTQISGGTLYLDTNFVMRLVGLDGVDLFTASKKLVDLSRQLGYSVVISPQTQREYHHTLERKFGSMASSSTSLSPQLAELALAASSVDDIFSVYWREVRDKGPIEPRAFYEYYQQLEALLEQYGVAIDDTYHDEVIDQEAALSVEASILRQTVDTIYGAERLDKTSDAVIEHDAYHRLLIRRYRQGIQNETFGNARAWFITFDSKLPPYDRDARHREGCFGQTQPFCVLSGQWLQIIRPFVGQASDSDVAQVDLLTSSMLRAYSKPPNDLINDIVTRLKLSDGRSPRVVGAMLADRQFLERFRLAPTAEIQQDVIDEYFFQYAVDAELKLERTQEQLKNVELERDNAKTEIEAAKHQLDKVRQHLEQVERDKASQELKIQEHDRLLQMQTDTLNAERDKTQEEADARKAAELQRQQDQEKAAIELARSQSYTKWAGIFLTGTILLVYLLGRHQFIVSPISTSEWIASIGVAMYIAATIYFNTWRSWLTILIPFVFVVSLFLPDEWGSRVQIVEPLIAVTLAVYTILNRKNSGR